MVEQFPGRFENPHCVAKIGTILAHSEEDRIRRMEAQARFELATVADGVQLYRDMAEVRDVLELAPGKRLMKTLMPGAVKAIDGLKQSLEDSLPQGRRRHDWEWHMLTLSTEKLAFIAIAGVLRGVFEGAAVVMQARVLSIASSIAGVVQDQIEFESWEKDQEDTKGELLLRLRKRYPNLDRRTWSKWRKKIEMVRMDRLGKIDSIMLGGALLNCVVEPNADYLSTGAFSIGSGKTELRVTVTAKTEELVEDITALAEVAHPPLRPMICPPNPWVYDGEKASGGYIIHRAQLVRGQIAAHSGAVGRSVSQTDLDAINRVQAVPWRINRRMFDLIEEARELRMVLPGLPVADDTVIPPSLPSDVWDAMTKEQRQEHTQKRAKAFEAQASVRGVAISVRDRMDVAAKVVNYPAIWFPHSRDFRGRLYPIPSRGPHPQADDLGKALIEFANGKPLGNDGLYWLMVRCANNAGQDKLPFDDRVQWCWDNANRIFLVADDPLGEGLPIWTEAEEPWQFIATCFEVADAMMSEDWTTFVSHLPVALDGSCNGLQHLSAMGLDAVGAAATNLTPDPVRHDIYEDVAVIVRQIVETDAAAGKPEALAWHGRVNRKTCKRSVMTTPYGVSDRGIRRQLIDDELVPQDTEVKKADLANYLGDCLGVGLGQTIRASKGIMAWFQTTAARLAAANLPMDWKTPTGSTVRQAYYEQNSRRVLTLAGQLVVFEEQLDAVLQKKRQVNGSAPNVIHSFDAAHLAMTVVAASEDGITDFAMIHDSYGTHAANTQRFASILRQQFVAIYKEDWLTKIRDDILAYAPHVELPDVPVRDTFDITQVLDAPFFFS
jgi:DNA-directed RNA polymerase